ncbi:MAG: hypothetical protein A2020_04855 [Lentisphaerae bacterium GWF2_45_14]|nr:MAG: hypothetical protein A2020_04855 [Lentisphaerae bacterium GWF2_45_14]
MKAESEILEVKSFFDGKKLHDKGPYTILVSNGRYHSILKGTADENFLNLMDAFRHGKVVRKLGNFIMPSMVESHCHIFLDGDELDAQKRSAYLKSPREKLVETAWRNIEKYRAKGIRTIRDAGDIHGINNGLRDILKNSDMTVISAGRGIRKKKRYGSFMAHEVEDSCDIRDAIKKIAETADTVKIILTGIIDFENGTVKDPFQFDADEMRLIVEISHSLGLKTFVHCSGKDGLRIAVESGVDSIEHGFFMSEDILEQMALKKIAWSPTFIPVHFQYAFPEYCGWNPATVDKLNAILENHSIHLCKAHKMGISILAGSDGGSYGVKHGEGLFEELALMRKAGLPHDAVLNAATLAPREHFGLASNAISIGNKADYICLEKFPLA